MDDAVSRFRIPKKLKISELDYFGEELGFNFNGDSQYRTKFGVICTMLFYSMIFLSGYYFLSKFFETKNPDVQFATYRIKQYIEADLPKKNYHIFFMLKNYHGEFLPVEDLASTLSVYGHSVSYKLDRKTKKQVYVDQPLDFEIVRCLNVDWYKSDLRKKYVADDSATDHLIKESAACITNSSIPIKGSPVDDTYTYLSIKVLQCEPDLVGTPEGERECFPEHFTGLSMTVGIFSAGIDIENKDNPLQYGLNIENSFTISLDNFVEVGMTVKKIEVLTDHGLFYERVKKDDALVLGAIRSSSILRKKPDGISNAQFVNNYPVFELKVESSNSVEQFSRSYVTMFDLFGNIGGTADMILFLIVLFYSWYNTYFFDRDLPKIYSKSFLPEDMIKSSAKPKNGDSISLKRYEAQKVQYEAMKEIVDNSLSLEGLMSSSNLNLFFEGIFLKDYQKMLLPIVALMLKKNEIDKKNSKKNVFY